MLGLAGCYVRPDELPEPPDKIPLIPDFACATGREAHVACTLDGDTFDVGACGEDQGERIRMLGINAPEIEHPGIPEECYGVEAEDVLRQLLDDQDITLTFDSVCTDPYFRTLAYVWLEDSSTGAVTLVNEWMLAQGHARLFDEDWVAPLRIQQRLDAAEASARARGLGLWAECGDDGG
jgi:micrococcal nuclease